LTPRSLASVTTVSDAWNALSAGRTHVDELGAPAEAGVYALFLAPTACLPGVEPPEGGLLYVGKSRNLAERDVDTHFATGHSGFSTVRRSLGALLRVKLDLKPVPRGTSASESNYRNYKFEDDGESRLTDWMRTNLEVAAIAATDYAMLEDALITDLQPVLCLKGWPNPNAAEIKSARKRCVEAARRKSR
jgi:hypothetical protein